MMRLGSQHYYMLVFLQDLALRERFLINLEGDEPLRSLETILSSTPDEVSAVLNNSSMINSLKGFTSDMTSMERAYPTIKNLRGMHPTLPMLVIGDAIGKYPQVMPYASINPSKCNGQLAECMVSYWRQTLCSEIFGDFSYR